MNNKKNNNNSSSIYSNFQSNTNQAMNNQNVNQNYQTQSYVTNNRNKQGRVLKVMMIVCLIGIIIGVGGFALVYTGVIKFDRQSPESILLNVNNVGVKKGKEYQYDYQVYPESTPAKNVYYESSNPDIAEVNPVTGYVTPKKTGTVTISVKSSEDSQVIEKSTLTITNSKVDVKELTLSSEKIVFDLSNKSKSQLLKVSTQPYDATTQNIEFSSADESVAIVDQTGRVYPVGFGMTNIIVRTKDGNAQAKCEVIVTDSENKKVYFDLPDNKGKIVFPYSIELETSYLKLKYGQSRKVGFTLLPPDVTEDVVTWISSNPSVATVKDGLIHGVAIGKATITARTVNDLVATLTVDVTEEEVEPTTVSFDEQFYELEIGQATTLVPKYETTATMPNFKWTSTNPNVVSVDSQGTITALTAGSATITASTSNGNSASVTVNVLKGEELANAIALESSTLELEVGASKAIEAEGNTGNDNFLYKSSDEQIATVNDRGVVTGVSEGKTTIYVSTVAGITAELETIVSEVEATRIYITSPKGDTVRVNETLELVAEVLPSNAINKNVTWESSNTKVLTVNNGIVKGVSTGKATVTAFIGEDLKANLNITVVGKNAKLPEEKPVVSSALSESEKEKLKNLPLTIEQKGDNKLLVTLDLDKYGYSDCVDASKTTFKIVNKASTISNLKIQKDKSNSVYITYKAGSYGTFEIEPTVVLKESKEKITIKTTSKSLTIETKVSFDIEKGASVPVQVNFASKYQSYAKNVTNWKSTNSSLVTAEDGYFEANEVGTATLTGDYQGVVFTAVINVYEPNRVQTLYYEQDYTYAGCYNLCPNGTISDTNIKTSSSNCSSDKPYYIDKPNKEYHYTCKIGNVKEVYTGKSSGLPAIEDKLVFNYSTNPTVIKGQKITVKINNWSKLNLKSASITNSLTSGTTTIKKASYSFDIPSSTTAKTVTLSVTAKNNNNREYKSTLVLTISSEPVISELKCEPVTVAAGSKANLSCTMFDKTNNETLAITEAKYSSNKKSVADVEATTGVVSGYKKGTAKITVKAHGKSTSTTVTVTDGIPVYTKLAVALTKTNKSQEKNEIEINESATLSYTLSQDGKNKATENLDVKYSTTDTNVVTIAGNQVTGKGVGTATITATYVNTKGKTLTNTVKVKVVAVGNLTPQVTELACGSDIVQVKKGDTLAIQCQMYDKTYESWLEVRNAKYSVDNKTYISVDENGVVSAKKVGTGTVTVKVGTKSKKIKIQVKSGSTNYSNIEANIDGKNEVELLKGATATISYRLNTANGDDGITQDAAVKITSSKPKIVSVNGTTVTAKKAGTSKITVSYNISKNKSISATVTVKVYEYMTCYRYKEETESYKECKSGYGYKNNKPETCYKVVEATSKETCLYENGSFVTGRKWQDSKCYDETKWYPNEKTKGYSDYKFTSKLKTAKKYIFDENNDTFKSCRDECSAATCNK